MKPADIAHLVTIGSPTLSPDGRHAVVAATRPDLAADEYHSALWFVTVDGSAPPRQLTHGDHDSDPTWSPDGATIAFLRATGDEKAQLNLLPVAGGDARKVTDLRGGAGSPVWSPDSSRIAFAARVPDAGRYGDKDADGKTIPAGNEPPRRITGLEYRLDGLGFILDRRSHLFVVDVTAESPHAEQITDGDWDDTDPAWHPDGSTLAFVSRRHDDRDLDRYADVFTVSSAGGDARIVTDTSVWATRIVWTPAGDDLLFVGEQQGPGGWVGNNVGLFHVTTTGGAPHRLTDPETVNLAGAAPVVVGDDVLVAVENRGAVELRALPLAGGETRVIVGGRRTVTGVAHAAGVTVVSYSDLDTAGELGRVDGETVTVLTSFATPGLALDVEAITGTAPDGYEVPGFLALPTGSGPHPVLLLIHGGPFAQYGWTLFDEAQVYAAAGYAVVFGNPRGSSGHGQAHGRHIVGDVGERSAADLLALLDATLERPSLDASRVGVLGGSHGGFMTTWLIGHTNRFKAAVSERAVNAIDSFVGSSDIGWDFADNLYGTDPDRRQAQSPFTYVDAIDTPLLIIHSEHDWRCPIEQAQRLYVSLRLRGATVEMLLFPDEGHELSRSGLPSHRIARFDAILDWFARHV